jgi:hypothetical protein
MDVSVHIHGHDRNTNVKKKSMWINHM